MTKAKTLDPLEQTLKRFPHLRKKHQDTSAKTDTQSQSIEHGLQICPNCGAKALRLDGGCMSCLSCGWSACG